MQAIWQPSEERIRSSNLTQFKNMIEKKYHVELKDYKSLHDFSIGADDASTNEKFWSTLFDHYIIASQKGDVILENKDAMPGAKWFPQARLNFAENLLRKRSDDDIAIIFKAENEFEQELSYSQLFAKVSSCAQALKDMGVVKGDRVAAMMPNMPDTIIFMLATTSLGAIWSSCSPDFGVNGVVDRFGQIKPKVFIGVNGYYYNGKTHRCLDKIDDIQKNIPSLEKIIIVAYSSSLHDDISSIDNAIWLEDFITPFINAKEKSIAFEQVEFDHPLYIMFSSGTTGIPKCIVHGTGGTLLQHIKEHVLHTNVKPNDKLFYYTTCGWMMWNWLVSGLACGAVLMLYDGSPFYPGPRALFRYAEKYKMNVFGTSAKYIEAVMKTKRITKNRFDLSHLKTVLSTGSPLSPEGFRFVYHYLNDDVCLSSISGGTDIVSCFALGSDTLPVYEGELQCIGLGMNVKSLDDEGNECAVGEKGELSCLSPFPCMPVRFWNDEKGQKYQEAYFDKIENTWCHGDYIEITQYGGMIIHGRSDAVLNPGGVRIGTAEIYRQVEKMDEVLESIVIGQRWNNDVRVVLFVKLKSKQVLDEDLIMRIKQMIRDNTTSRHVPEIVLQVEDIPRTKSGKIVEIAVRNIVHGEKVKNIDALSNPEALSYFENIAELST